VKYQFISLAIFTWLNVTGVFGFLSWHWTKNPDFADFISLVCLIFIVATLARLLCKNYRLEINE